jgi:hypothetical protein
VASLCLVGCTGKSREAAQAATEKFRARCFRGAFDEIYAAASPEFRSSMTTEQFSKFMAAVDRKLGRWQASDPPAWNVTIGTGGRAVTLGYKSDFEKGEAREQFVWRIVEPEPILVGYRIESRLLVLE